MANDREKTSNRGGQDRLRNTLSKFREYEVCLRLKFKKESGGFPRDVRRLSILSILSDFVRVCSSQS